VAVFKAAGRLKVEAGSCNFLMDSYKFPRAKLVLKCITLNFELTACIYRVII